VLNQSPFNSGSYTLVATCSSTISDTLIEVFGSPLVLETVPPASTAPFSFAITAAGPLILGDTKCEITLSAGVGGTIQGEGIPEAGFLDKTVVSCDLFLPTLIYYAYQDFILDPFPNHGENCPSWDIICMLNNAPWYLQYMGYIVLAIIALAIILVVASGLYYAITRADMLRAKGKLWRRYEQQADSR
jgi:hypothetical protein